MLTSDPASWWLMTVGFPGPAHFRRLSQLGYLSAHLGQSPEDQARFKFHRTWLAYSTVPMFILGLSVPGLTGVFVYIYLITVFWHYTAQTFGISLIYCYKRGYIMNQMEKDIFRWFMFSMVGFVSVRSFLFQGVQPE